MIMKWWWSYWMLHLLRSKLYVFVFWVQVALLPKDPISLIYFSCFSAVTHVYKSTTNTRPNKFSFTPLKAVLFFLRFTGRVQHIHTTSWLISRTYPSPTAYYTPLSGLHKLHAPFRPSTACAEQVVPMRSALIAEKGGETGDCVCPPIVYTLWWLPQNGVTQSLDTWRKAGATKTSTQIANHVGYCLPWRLAVWVHRMSGTKMMKILLKGVWLERQWNSNCFVFLLEAKSLGIEFHISLRGMEKKAWTPRKHTACNGILDKLGT